MRRTISLLGLLSLLSALAVGSPGGRAAAADRNPLQVGVQFKGMWSDYTDAQRAVVLDRLVEAGVDEVRIDVSWAMLQPDGPDSYDPWGVDFVDRVLAMAHSRGLAPLVTLWMSPEWANGGRGDRALPLDPQDYARAAGWAAGRWAGTVSSWEVWNEANSDDFMRGADPAAYAGLLRAAYPAIHAGNPAATVVFAGTMYVDTDWIAQAYAAGVQGSFDAMAVHPYMGVADQAPETPDDGTQWTLDHVRALHELMTANGDGDKDIWFTEMGWSSHANAPGAANWNLGVSEQVQAQLAVRALRHIQASYPYVTHAFWYTEHDRDDSHLQDNHYGLLRQDLSPKPVYHALAAHLLGRTSAVPAVLAAPEPPAAGAAGAAGAADWSLRVGNGPAC